MLSSLMILDGSSQSLPWRSTPVIRDLLQSSAWASSIPVKVMNGDGRAAPNMSDLDAHFLHVAGGFRDEDIVGLVLDVEDELHAIGKRQIVVDRE